MDLKFSEMSVDTSLAQKYLKENAADIEIYKSHDGQKVTTTIFGSQHNNQNTILKIASKLKENANLIAQLEYYNRNIPIEVTIAQLNLFIQYIQCRGKSFVPFSSVIIYPDNPLLVFAQDIFTNCRRSHVENNSTKTAAIYHLLVTLHVEAGAKEIEFYYEPVRPDSDRLDSFAKLWPVKGLDSGTVAVVSDDADVDSAVDKFIAVPIEAPWRLRRILVQESVYQQFKDALSWKCNLNKSVRKSLTSDVLCSETLTYKDKTFLIDPVQLTQENSSRHIITVEAYRTTKEMISLVQQYKTRYLSLWINGIAEINEVTHSTMAPVVWVNNVADFRGPPQVSKAVFSDGCFYEIKKCEKVAKLCALSQSWLKLDLESRRDVLYRFLDQLDQKELYTDIKKSLSACTLNSFVDVGKDYVCIGMSQPKGIVGSFYKKGLFASAETFELILKGNALIVFLYKDSEGPDNVFLQLLEQSGVPVACLDFVDGDFPVWDSTEPNQTRVVWTNSGTIFAN